MTPEEAVRDRILALSAVTALVGTRVYRLMFPQSPTWPAIRVTLVDSHRRHTLTQANGLQRARVQVDCTTEAAAGVDALADVTTLASAVVGDGALVSPTGVNNYRALQIDSPAYDVKGMWLLDRAERYDADDLRLVTSRLDFDVWIKA